MWAPAPHDFQASYQGATSVVGTAPWARRSKSQSDRIRDMRALGYRPAPRSAEFSPLVEEAAVGTQTLSAVTISTFDNSAEMRTRCRSAFFAGLASNTRKY